MALSASCVASCCWGLDVGHGSGWQVGSWMDVGRQGGRRPPLLGAVVHLLWHAVGLAQPMLC